MADAEYPGTLARFDRWFATEDACRKYPTTLRWPGGFRCPGCESSEAWLTVRALMHCKGCGRQVSVTAGTIFHGTRSSLRLWFQAMWWVTAQTNGASAPGLQGILGLGSYETAWTWLRLVQQALAVDPAPYRILVGGSEQRASQDVSCLS